MRGVVLCGGNGTRLGPLTVTTNKHLLPIYDKPMCFYPIETLLRAGITDIAIVVSGTHAGGFMQLLQNGERFGLKKLTYLYQSKERGGIADALSLAENFADNDDIMVVLGDNTMDIDVKDVVDEFSGGAEIFLKEVPNPKDFGVAKFSENGALQKLVEKPQNPPSNLVAIGLYIFDSKSFDFIKNQTPSGRGELEIVDLLNQYIEREDLNYSVVDGFWKDAGTPENLYLSNKYWFEKAMKDKNV